MEIITVPKVSLNVATDIVLKSGGFVTAIMTVKMVPMNEIAP